MSRINLIFSLFFLLLIAGLFSFTTVQSRNPAGTDWDTQNLSNHIMSEGGVKRLNLAGSASGNFVHAAWMEMTEINETEYTLELFYRTLPLGTTRKVGISDTQPINYANSALRTEMRSHENGRACLATYTKHLWCNDYDAPIKFTNNSIVDLHFFMDDNGNAHLVWIENDPVGIYHQEIYYWSEPNKTTRLLSIYDSWSYITYLDVLFDEELYLAWNEYNETNKWTPYYWNSKEQLVIDLTMVGTTFSNNFKIFKDEQANIDLFWVSQDELDNYCPVHWTEGNGDWLFVDHELCGSENSYFFAENDGTLFATWMDRDGQNSYYWDSNIVTPIKIFSPLRYQTFDDMWSIIGPDNTLHFLWLDDTSVNMTVDDVYYWNSKDQEILNISNGILGDIEDHYLETIFSDDGTLHVIWPEGTFDKRELYYWNTNDKNLITISDTSPASGEASFHKSIPISAQDIQITWPENNTIYSWKSTTNQKTTLFDYSADATLLKLWYTTNNSIKLLWSQPEEVNPDNRDLFIWEEGGEATNLSLLANTNGNMNAYYSWEYGQTLRLTNDENQDFILWAEDSGTAEGEDLYVAHPRINLDNAVYLPTVIR